jgi:hypothetical protein
MWMKIIYLDVRLSSYGFILFFILSGGAGMGVAAQVEGVMPVSYLAGCSATAYDRDWIAFQNPAALGGVQHTALNALFQNRFGMKELSTGTLSLSVPVGSFRGGVAVSHFGFEDYNESMVGLALAKTFDKRLTLGIQADYYLVSMSAERSNKACLLVQVGLLSKLLPGFTVGFSVFNPVRQSIQYESFSQRVPSVASLGIGYDLTDDLQWIMQIDKEMEADIRIAGGFEYRPVDILTLRVGGYGAPFVPTLGAGVLWKKIRFDVNFERHVVLGVTSVAGLQYTF